MLRFPAPILLAMALPGCGAPDSPEQQIRAVIEQVEIAAESRDVGDLIEHISQQYQDRSGLGRDD